MAAALWLVNMMFSLAALYVMLDAQFVGAMQVLVYAGAIMVVFLFVVMLLNLGQPSDVDRHARARRGSSPRALVGLALLAELFARHGAAERFALPRAHGRASDRTNGSHRADRRRRCSTSTSSPSR